MEQEMAYTKRGYIIDKNTLKNLYIRQGRQKKEICEILSCTTHILNKSIKKHNIEKLLDRYIVYLYNSGKRQNEIGKILKRDQAAISRKLLALGVDCKKARYKRIEETILKKYGVENIQQHPEYREKTTNTNKNKYGYEHPLERYNSHISGYFEKNKNDILKRTFSSLRTTKEYIFPSGRKERVQGAEPLAIDILLKTYTEDEIVTSEKSPIIPYHDRGKNRKHYTDLYLPKENRIIEVKTPYTMSITSSLMEKFHAAVEMGYLYEIWVFDGKKELIEIIKTPSPTIKYR